MRFRARQAQQGVVLFIALIVLVAMSLAGVALMRGVDTGTLIAGNLGFRQNAVHVSDLGVEAARAWIMTEGATNLYNDRSSNAYYATWQDMDFLGTDASKADFNWTANSASVTAAPFAPPPGYEVRYVIHRLCQGSGDPTGSTSNCIKVSASAAGTTASGTKGAAAYGSYAISVPTAAMYRITVRVTGPRNSVSFVQATVY